MKRILNSISNFLFQNGKGTKSRVVKNNTTLKEIVRWRNDNGDLTHRINYDLNEDSVVFDLGGYEGWFASRIFCKYLCNIYIFEPVVEYAEFIRSRFEHANKVFVFPFGLAKKTEVVEISLLEYSSSIFKQGGIKSRIDLVNCADFFSENGIEFIDLMKINIEGGEYDLLDALIEHGLVKKIKNLQIQFHDFVPNAELRMESIQRQLSTTHKLTYQYNFIWENWQLK